MAKTAKAYLIQISQADLETIIFDNVLKAVKANEQSAANVKHRKLKAKQKLLPQITAEVMHG